VERQPMHFVAIVGTVRPGNFTSKALALVADEVQSTPRCSCEIIDAATLDLPFPGRGSTDDAERLREAVSGATGVILATPEYHGSFSSVTKLVIENLGFPSVLAGKPVGLLGVAAGRIGAIKSLESLRGVCSHVGAIVLPGPISVANVQSVFDDDGSCTDPHVEKALRSLGTAMTHYVEQNVCPRMALEAMVRAESTN
jgi:chromate reductase, NAD(P)H dehydrogenase (quinone)